MGVSQFELPDRLTILAQTFQGHLAFVQTLKSMFLALWYQHNGLPCHVISAKKDSRAATEAQRTWRPSLTDVFRLCCCSLSVQRRRAREVIHDASLCLVTVSRHKSVLRVENKHGPGSVLVDFLSLCYNTLAKD